MSRDHSWKRDWRLKSGSAPDRSAATITRRPWTVEENRMVMARNRPDRELAALLGRSIQAIQTQRASIRHGGYAGGTANVRLS